MLGHRIQERAAAAETPRPGRKMSAGARKRMVEGAVVGGNRSGPTAPLYDVVRHTSTAV